VKRTVALPPIMSYVRSPALLSGLVAMLGPDGAEPVGRGGGGVRSGGGVACRVVVDTLAAVGFGQPLREVRGSVVPDGAGCLAKVSSVACGVTVVVPSSLGRPATCRPRIEDSTSGAGGEVPFNTTAQPNHDTVTATDVAASQTPA